MFLTNFKRDLKRMHPTFPEGARCFFWNIPYFIGFQLANGAALRVWYDNPSLEGLFISKYTRDPDRPRFFFAHDFAARLFEITPGCPDPDLKHPSSIYADAHAHLGYCLSRAGEMDLAIVECRKALQMDPYNRAAITNLGIFLVETAVFEEGAAVLEPAARAAAVG